MLTYKRNQVEEALGVVLIGGPPDTSLRGLIQRLLDTDRRIPVTRSIGKSANPLYAFYTDPPSGSGKEVWYRQYDVFSLWIGLRLLGSGWPQATAVRLLRGHRLELEMHHTRIMKQDSSILFDEAALISRARPGAIAFGSTDPTLLVFGRFNRKGREGEPQNVEIVRGEARFFERLKTGKFANQMVSFIELTVPAHRIAAALAVTKPKRRGPPAK